MRVLLPSFSEFTPEQPPLSDLKRRLLLRVFRGCHFACIAAVASSPLVAAEPSHTNMLWICADELAADPEEFTNVAARPEISALVKQFTQQLAEHLRRTAREPDQVPATDDIYSVID